jgi:hypothetical protein
MITALVLLYLAFWVLLFALCRAAARADERDGLK